GVSASLIWGSAFLVPVLLGGWNPVIVTLGRYLVYGLLSAILFTLGGGGPRRVLREHWRTALAFALAGNAVYYLLLVIGVRAAGALARGLVHGRRRRHRCGGASRAARGRARRPAHHAVGRAPGTGQAGRRGRLPRRRGLLGGHVAVEYGLEPAVARRGRAAGQ